METVVIICESAHRGQVFFLSAARPSTRVIYCATLEIYEKEIEDYEWRSA